MNNESTTETQRERRIEGSQDELRRLRLRDSDEDQICGVSCSAFSLSLAVD